MEKKKILPSRVENPRKLSPRQLLDAILAAAWERKAYDTVVLDAAEVIGYTDYLVIMTGRSTRHVSSVANFVTRELRNLGVRPMGEEGVRYGRWVVLDYGAVVMHIFLQELRELYDLEGLWSDCPRVEVQEPQWVQAFQAASTGLDDLGLEEDLDDF